MDLYDMACERYLNGREIENRVDELETDIEAITSGEAPVYASDGRDLPELEQELKALRDIVEEIESYADDQLRNTTLIAEEVWLDYCRDFASDIHGTQAIEGAAWPFDYIDWEAAGKALAQDYNEVTIGDFTFLYR